MLAEKSRLSLGMFRCPSAISTTDGGLTPQTDLGSPLVRTPESPFSDDYIASTNLLQIALVPGFRADEYWVQGSMDLVMFAFESLVAAFATDKVIFLPGGESVSILVITDASFEPPPVIPGIPASFLRSHLSLCRCSTCVRMMAYLVSGDSKIGRYEYLDARELMLPILSPLAALPGHRAKVTCEAGTLAVALDMVVQWIAGSGSGSQSVLAARQKSSRLELSLGLVGQWVFSVYNGRVYRVKKIWFELTPLSEFFDKKTGQRITYSDYVKERYGLRAQWLSGPLLEVFAEKRSEQCFLLPEFCFSLNDGPHVPMHTVHALTRISASDRQRVLETTALQLSVKEKFKTCIDLTPVHVRGHLLASVSPYKPPQLGPAPLHSVRYAVVADDTESAVRFLSNTVFSGPPMASGPVAALEPLVRSIAAHVDLVIVVLKGKQTATYTKAKYVCLVECGVACQVVRSETMSRKNSEISADLVAQIACKVGLPTAGMHEPVVALDFHRFGDLSIFSVCFRDVAGGVACKYSIEQSAALNEDEMVHRYIALLSQWQDLLPLNPVIIVAARRGIPKSIKLAHPLRKLLLQFTLVVMCVKTDLRLFASTGNVAPGYVFDADLELSDGSVADGFYLTPHAVDQGNALPVYFVVAECGSRNLEDVKNCVWMSVSGNQKHRLPELFRHTLKLSELIGIYLRKHAGKDLVRNMKNSAPWRSLVASNRCFYL